ncbi:metallophosphoesterase family protein [Nannocystis sp.]|uniref:metallophosphoesterase family protein n=1 Tax=Nannocystis sp. TaxID=1962667 RepID=UPI0025CE92C5|nr:metallophosphoesterase family protein [Nannocystis sp.]MBK7826296.1 metallophosphoesterase family protein [Nannocystis sp.]
MIPTRRFAAIGDIHAEDRRLDVVLTWLKSQAVDAILSVGDLADGAGDLDRCCRGALWACAECWFQDPFRHSEVGPAALRHLAELPPTRRLSTLRGDLLLCHGVGEDDMIRLRPGEDVGRAGLAQAALAVLLADTGLRIVVGGHTHERMVRSFPRQAGPPLVFINPGTLHRDFAPGFALVDLERGVVEFHDVDERPGSALAIGLTGALAHP